MGSRYGKSGDTPDCRWSRLFFPVHQIYTWHLGLIHRIGSIFDPGWGLDSDWSNGSTAREIQTKRVISDLEPRLTRKSSREKTIEASVAGLMAGLRMIDIAVNLTDGMFKGMYNGKKAHAADIPVVLQRAWKAGVDRIIVTGGSLEESKEALAIAETDDHLFCTVGVHPTRCMEFEENVDPENHFQELLSLARRGVEIGKVVAIGECGLDYDRTHFCSPEVQKRYFEKQFQLAGALKLPMFLHMRAAAKDFCDILSRNKHLFTTGVAHSFTGSAADCNLLLEFNDLYIGINGCSLKTAENLDVVRSIPIERLMVETDSPYCEIKNTHAGNKFVTSVWPSKKKEKYDPDFIVKGRNEPCAVRQVLEVLAACKGAEDINQLCKTIYKNTCRLFFPNDIDAARDNLIADNHSS